MYNKVTITIRTHKIYIIESVIKTGLHFNRSETRLIMLNVSYCMSKDIATTTRYGELVAELYTSLPSIYSMWALRNDITRIIVFVYLSVYEAYSSMWNLSLKKGPPAIII